MCQHGKSRSQRPIPIPHGQNHLCAPRQGEAALGLDEEHPGFTREWRYYKDGKSWLMKVQHKKKTVFWLSILRGTFRTTFYVHEKAKKMIEESALTPKLKDQFRTGKSYGKIRGITMVYKTRKDVEFAKELIGIKLRIK